MSAVVLARRGFIGGLAALVAAPAIVKVESLMSVRGVPLVVTGVDYGTGDMSAVAVMARRRGINKLLSIDMITRESVALFTYPNLFLKNLDDQYDEALAVEGAKIGSTLRIRLPNDFQVTNDNSLHIQHPASDYVYDKARRTLIPRQAEISALHDIPAPLAVAAGVAAVVAKNPAVSRRFWSR